MTTFSDEDEIRFKKIRKDYDRKSVDEKVDLVERRLNIPLKHIRACTYNTEHFRGNIENPIGVIQIPLGIVGPLKINGKNAKGEFFVPMATTEGVLLLTYDLGCRVVNFVEPVKTEIISKSIHITPMFPISSGEDTQIERLVQKSFSEIKKIAESGSSHTTLIDIERKRVKDNFLLKFKFDTDDAHGLNMINHGAFHACKYIENTLGVSFYLRSHYSGVKHHSLLNESDGYGRKVKASGFIPEKALTMLRVKADKVKDFTDRCIAVGGKAKISSINVHAANAIAAIFLACGQDAADISSSHVCESKCEIIDKKNIYWECTLKNLLIATVGGGTSLGTQRECLQVLDCFGSGKSDKFAEIIAATVLAGELTTAAAIINETYVDMHNRYGRNKNVKPV